MNTEEFIAKLDARIQQMDEAKLVFGLASAVHAKQIDRIFGRGEKASGKIGTYDQKEMYASKRQFKGSGFKAQGKRGDTKFKDGKPHLSMYLGGGYKQLKAVQGYESGFVNLTYSADLRNDFATHLIISENSVLSGVSRKINADKINGLKEKYGMDLFDLNHDEREFFKTESTRIVVNYITGRA